MSAFDKHVSSCYKRSFFFLSFLLSGEKWPFVFSLHVQICLKIGKGRVFRMQTEL